MQQQYEKFNEWLLLKKYSPATTLTTIRIVEYFRQWAESENITELEEVSYQDAMSFMQWSSKHGASQKTIANYLNHIRKFYQFLISEGAVKENPVAHIKVQGIRRRIYHDILSTEELHQLYSLYLTTIAAQAGKNMPPQEKKQSDLKFTYLPGLAGGRSGSTQTTRPATTGRKANYP